MRPERSGETPDDRITPALRFGVRTTFAAAALILVTVPFGVLLLLVRTDWGPLHRADLASSGALHRYAEVHPGFVTAMRVLSTIGATWVWFVVFAVVAAWLLRRRRPRLAVFVVVTVAGSSLINNLVKLAVDRSRPVLPDPVAVAPGFSFPSGHAQAAIVGYAVLAVVFLPLLPTSARRIGLVLAALMVVAIGFSRIALGVHYLSDVLAGYALGAAWVAAMIATFNAWRRERRGP